MREVEGLPRIGVGLTAASYTCSPPDCPPTAHTISWFGHSCVTLARGLPLAARAVLVPLAPGSSDVLLISKIQPVPCFHIEIVYDYFSVCASLMYLAAMLRQRRTDVHVHMSMRTWWKHPLRRSSRMLPWDLPPACSSKRLLHPVQALTARHAVGGGVGSGRGSGRGSDYRRSLLLQLFVA